MEVRNVFSASVLRTTTSSPEISSSLPYRVTIVRLLNHNGFHAHEARAVQKTACQHLFFNRMQREKGTFKRREIVPGLRMAKLERHSTLITVACWFITNIASSYYTPSYSLQIANRAPSKSTLPPKRNFCLVGLDIYTVTPLTVFLRADSKSTCPTGFFLELPPYDQLAVFAPLSACCTSIKADTAFSIFAYSVVADYLARSVLIYDL